MTCGLHSHDFGRPAAVTVNGVAIPRDRILREIQHHPAATPAAAWQAAARALVVRELLRQEADRLGIAAQARRDDGGCEETAEEASLRILLEHQVRVPEPDAATCQRYYDQHPQAFLSPALYEAAHILFAARRDDDAAFAAAQALAETALSLLREAPERFAELARAHSACSSAHADGYLGQVAAADVTPEFAAGLERLPIGGISDPAVPSRYGLHIIRLDRREAGRRLPFSAVAARIAGYLRVSVEHRACAQYVARLVSRADIAGIAIADAAAHRVN